MGHLILIIKGDSKAARIAATRHGVALLGTVASRHNGETNATCNDADIIRVMEWFAEPPLRAPFPVGALLHWSEQTRV